MYPQRFKHGSPLVSCRFDPTGKYLVAGGQDNKLSRFTLPGDTRVELTSSHDSWVRGIVFSPTGDTMVTGGYDGRLVWWPITADQPTRSTWLMPMPVGACDRRESRRSTASHGGR